MSSLPKFQFLKTFAIAFKIRILKFTENLFSFKMFRNLKNISLFHFFYLCYKCEFSFSHLPFLLIHGSFLRKTNLLGVLERSDFCVSLPFSSKNGIKTPEITLVDSSISKTVCSTALSISFHPVLSKNTLGRIRMDLVLHFVVFSSFSLEIGKKTRNQEKGRFYCT